jgi:hypothetical protein
VRHPGRFFRLAGSQPDRTEVAGERDETLRHGWGRSVGRGQRQLDRPDGWEQPGEGHVLWPASDDRRWYDGDAVPGGRQADHGVQVDGFLRYPRWACVIAT